MIRLLPFAFMLMPASLQATMASQRQAASEPARALAEQLLPAETLVQARKDRFLRMFRAETISEEDRRLEQQHPGLFDVLANAAWQITEVAMRKALPDLHAQFEELVEARLEPSEVETALVFFASPTGTKLRSALASSLDEGSEEAVKAKAQYRFDRQLTPADRAALGIFGTSPAASKLQNVRQAFKPRIELWWDTLYASILPDIEARSTEAARAHINGERAGE